MCISLRGIDVLMPQIPHDGIEIRDSLSEFLWKRTKRSPMILPIIMEV
jgi:hypothetical protein